jgi:hypothetical protein
MPLRKSRIHTAEEENADKTDCGQRSTDGDLQHDQHEEYGDAQKAGCNHSLLPSPAKIFKMSDKKARLKTPLPSARK